ncbi:penicillin-binding protein 2 [Thermoflexus sp.]|uniref:penicillin-binding protein 2 n=1 Tax=Thermoflexus sp. TaxID=1969742 RepID=UPI00176296D0|nr:penicillin-binding protein 2 [Thermoflexus sp.]
MSEPYPPREAEALDSVAVFRSPPPPPPSPHLRLILWALVIALGFAGLGYRLYRLQIVEGPGYRALGERNRLRVIPLEAPRGILLDRQGRPLVQNDPAFRVLVTPGDLPEDPAQREAIFQQLSRWLGIPVESGGASAQGQGGPGIRERIQAAAREAPFRPLVLKEPVDREIAFRLMEESSRLPGVQVELVLQRRYPTGPLTAHVVGFVGRIPAEQAARYQAQGYDPAVDRVGLSGLEYALEPWLRGTKGARYVEEDARGRPVRVLAEIPPQAGARITLTLDLELQAAARAALQAKLEELNRIAGREITRRGVVLAMRPTTGEILAMVSLPDYDNNWFVSPDLPQAYSRLVEDPFAPLLNHAIASQFAPGSSFKPIVAAAALQEGVITPRTRLFDPGEIVIPNRYFPNDPGLAQHFFCWLRSGHGWQDVVDALANSCNVFFYKVAGGYDVPGEPVFEGLGIERLVRYMHAFGLGRPTGIELPGEAAGQVPDPEWKRKTFGETWSTGDTYNLGIGQGYLLVTPLQLLNAISAIANGGTLYRPTLVREIAGPDGNLLKAFQPEVMGRLPIAPEHLTVVRDGMVAAVERGTAVRAQIPGIRIAGKTGTAEFCDDLALRMGLCSGRRLPSHAWFVAFAPAEAPEIAILVFIWNGGEGSQNAAPVAREVLEAYFRR